MADILNTYPVFESNQVLTSTQLNNLVNYLDQQNRLTRTRLIGMGVVCGLELSHDPATQAITISKGTGITSEGYLISMGECETVKYRDYSLPPGTIYEPFVDPGTNEMDIQLWELLTDEADETDTTPLNTPAGFLSDKVVLLFVESYDKDLKSCLGKSCDELGKERILTIRKLLITKADLATVWARTNTGKLDALFPEKFNLPVINMPRVLFNPEQPNSSDYDAFSENYANAVLNVFDAVFDALIETFDVYRPLLLESYDEQNPFENNPIDDLQNVLLNFLNNSASPGTPYLGVQYVYDLFQDLISAYTEFKNTAFDLMSECTPDMSRFPKHLMLGEAIPPGLSLCEQSEYRHVFVQPPVYNLQGDLLQRTIALHNRIVLMLESFDLERVNAALEEEFDIRITPSNEKVTALSLRSIPWYYDPNTVSSYDNLGRLKDYWSYDVSRKCPLESDGLVLNYDDQDSDQSSAQDKLATPLFYDIADYPFLRIEGHIDLDFEEALDTIDALKDQFDLPFKSIALQLDPDVSTLELDYSCGFEDIQEEYTVLRASFCGFIADIQEVYTFVEQNQDLLFDEDEEGDDDIGEILERIKDLLNYFDEMCQAMDECVQDFDFEDFQNSYKEMLTYVIDFILVEMDVMDEIEIDEEDQEEQIEIINGAVQRVFPILYKILDLLFYNRFLRIYYSFKRREFYLRKETAVFSSFIQKHPGVEHQAGVPKGGTFILVYNGGEDTSVIADFNLPYLCCTEDRCVPACDDSFVFEVLPFARPDYAITTVNNAVEVDVIRNDANIIGGSFKISTSGTSESGGDVEQLGDTGPLVYTPPKDFVGYDTFEYQLADNESGEVDTGTVTVLVKEAGQDEECYSVQVLECWGEEAVKETLQDRGIEISADDNIYEVLLESLRQTSGFTIDEIEGGVLEEEFRRRNLLNCLGIEIPGDATYDDLQQLILQYQAENCSGGGAGTCYTVPILQCWGRKNVIAILNLRQLPVGNNPFQQLLGSLRQTGGFNDQEIEFMLETNVLHILLQCMGFDVGENTPPDEMRDIILAYQADNCSGGDTGDERESRSPTIDLKLVGTNELVNLLKARGKTVGDTSKRKDVENTVKNSDGGNTLTKTEAEMLSKKSLTRILEKKGLTFTSRDNKETLIRKLVK
jgi:hypothetical protein